jgi:ubiquitin-activating enzyme E1 C
MTCSILSVIIHIVLSIACVNEAFKLLTFSSQSMNTYMMYMGQEGTYSTTYDNVRNPNCIVCSDAADVQILNISGDTLLQDFINLLCVDPKFQLKKPSLVGEENNMVYMHGPLEKSLRPNLDKPLSELIEDGETLTITDPTLRDISLAIQVVFS